MSCNYADGLSPYDDKGILGAPEKFDTAEKVEEKCKLLAKWILESQHVVVHTGAGISTSAGIPDFRGPNGVWTLEKKGLKPNINISFDEAVPTKTHMALSKLVEAGYVKYIVSQNIDGLHLKSGIPRHAISELHGNMFTENCSTCKRQFIRNSATTSVGQKPLGKPCPGSQTSRRGCRGKLHDTVLDWEDNLPDDDLIMADYHSSIADINICLGTTLQIVPSGNLPLQSKKYGGLLAIVNLQPTKHDKKANLLINAYVDVVIEKIMKYIGLEIPIYMEENDPTKTFSDKPGEWNFLKLHVNEMKSLYTDHTKKLKRIKHEQKLEKEEANKKLKKENIDVTAEQTNTNLETKEIDVSSEQANEKLRKEEDTTSELGNDDLEKQSLISKQINVALEKEGVNGSSELVNEELEKVELSVLSDEKKENVEDVNKMNKNETLLNNFSENINVTCT